MRTLRSLFLLACVAMLADAQTTRTPHGLVTDQSDGAIASATVTALHVGTGLTRTTTF